MAKGARVDVKGVKELIRAFDKFNKDLSQDLIWELQEAADPVRKTTEEYILQGGGGFPSMRGVVKDPYFAGMRIGVSRATSSVYVAPSWRSNKGTRQGRILAAQEAARMEGALESKAGEVEKKLEKFIDTLADDWGQGL